MTAEDLGEAIGLKKDQDEGKEGSQPGKIVKHPVNKAVKRYRPFGDRHENRSQKRPCPKAESDQGDEEILNEKTRFEKPDDHP